MPKYPNYQKATLNNLFNDLDSQLLKENFTLNNLSTDRLFAILDKQPRVAIFDSLDAQWQFTADFAEFRYYTLMLFYYCLRQYNNMKPNLPKAQLLINAFNCFTINNVYLIKYIFKTTFRYDQHDQKYYTLNQIYLKNLLKLKPRTPTDNHIIFKLITLKQEYQNNNQAKNIDLNANFNTNFNPLAIIHNILSN